MKSILVAVVVLSFAVPAAAQQAPASYLLEVTQNVSGGTTFAKTIPASALTCGQPQVQPPNPNVNPAKLRWFDPANQTLDCVADVATFIMGLPITTGTQTYVATVTGLDAAGVGITGRSAASAPFLRQLAAMMGVRLTP